MQQSGEKDADAPPIHPPPPSHPEWRGRGIRAGARAAVLPARAKRPFLWPSRRSSRDDGHGFAGRDRLSTAGLLRSGVESRIDIGDVVRPDSVKLENRLAFHAIEVRRVLRAHGVGTGRQLHHRGLVSLLSKPRHHGAGNHRYVLVTGMPVRRHAVSVRQLGPKHIELARTPRIAEKHGNNHLFWLGPPEHRPPGGESFVDLRDRAVQSIERLTALHRGRDIVATAHGGTIRAALAHAFDLHPEAAVRFEIDNVSLTMIEHFEQADPNNAWRVGFVNYMPRDLVLAKAAALA